MADAAPPGTPAGEDLSLAQWAWAFLRRNPDYRRDWEWFHRTWTALEADYGRPPHRDYPRWKADPRAWREQDGERLLIECWMGLRWGFYKFPLDPDTPAPPPDRLAWRPLETDPPCVTETDTAWLGGDPRRLTLGFDLSYPLDAQLAAARRLLVSLQRARIRQQRLRPPRLAAWREDLARMVRILDAPPERPDAELAAALDVNPERLALLRAEALDLRAGGYRRLLCLAED